MNIALLFVTTLLLAIAFLVSLTIIISFSSLAPWVPTRTKDLARILELANLKSGDKFYDLGCGNGKVAFFIARNTSAQVTGIELAWPLYAFCQLKQLIKKYSNLTFKNKNVLKTDLSPATDIYVFGLAEKLSNKLKTKLDRELKPGSKIITYSFPITGWQPIKVSKPNPDDLSIYSYMIQ